MDWKTVFFSPEGRINRQTFWIAWLVLLGVNVVAGWIPLVGFIISLVTIWCSICIHSTRLHDMGKTGWLQVIPVIAWIVAIGVIFMSVGAAIVAGVASDGADDVMAMALAGGFGGALMAMMVAFLVGLVFLLWIGLTPGQAGANRFGAPPESATPAPAV